MYLLDRDIASSRALVIDPNPTSRSILASQLRELGVGHVRQCGRIAEARSFLELGSYDIVLCEMYFHGQEARGDELLDDLRRAGNLPLATVFVMVTGEATYARVAEAAEAALDGYLLKPFSATALATRLRQSRLRKKSLQRIYDAIEEDRHLDAAQLCAERFKARGPYWLYAARIGAELLLRLNQHDAAREMFEAILATQALPWARLGIARVQRDAGESVQARRTLEGLLASDPGYGDAYDVMGRVQVESGNLVEAQETYRKAAELTPGSLGRLQKHGMLAFYTGDLEAASKALQSAARLGAKSRMFDFQSLVLIGFTCFKQQDAKGLQRCVTDLAAAREKAPQSVRLRRFERVLQIASLMLGKQVGKVVSNLRDLTREIGSDDFDVEAACNMLTLLSMLAAAELNLPSAEDWVSQLALRFCSARGVTELLARSATLHPPMSEQVLQGQKDVGKRNEEALALSLAGDSTAAVHLLIHHAERTQNPRFLDTARGLMQRYPERIADVETLTARVEALRDRFGAANGVPRLGAEQVRQPGGVSLRCIARTEASAEAEEGTAEVVGI
jgi:CheY-like chemotaxis protein